MDSWDDYAAEWDDDEAVIQYADKALASLRGLVDLDGLAVLDFGCGTGLLTERMAPRAGHIVALDPSPRMTAVLEAKQIDRVDTVVAELTAETVAANPLLQGPFDLIVASSVCAFLPDYPQTLRLIRSLLRPGGRFVQWDWPQTDADPTFGFTVEMMESALRDAGLVDVAVDVAFALEVEDSAMSVLRGVGHAAAHTTAASSPAPTHQ